ncbi:MAG: ZrgA family zinc uptake protein, partial [Desulfocapsaceae bacterium]
SGAQEHSEFEAFYQFTCASPKKLKVMEVHLFSVFPGFEQLDLQILTTSGQTGAKLSAGNNRVEL